VVDAVGRFMGLAVSAGGRYVAALFDQGLKENTSTLPQVHNAGAYVFRIADLETPVLYVQLDHRPGAVAFDPVAERLYVGDEEGGVQVVSPFGTRLFRLVLPDAGKVSLIAVHPHGRSALARTAKAVYWIVPK